MQNKNMMSLSSHRTIITAGLLCFSGLLAAPPAAAADGIFPYPADPFAQDRRPIRTKEVGSARGQAHLFVLGALVDGKSADDVYFAGQIGIEFQLHEFGAIRLSGFQELVDGEGESLTHNLTSVRVGPALHLRPYRTVDLGAYMEGGVVFVDAVDGRFGDTAPEVVFGGFISIHFDSHNYIQLELEHAAANIPIDGVIAPRDRTAAKLGLAMVF